MMYTYVLRSKQDGKWYTGSTQDLRKRFLEHQSEKSTSLKGRAPLELIYYEACLDSQDARTREKYLKTGMGKRYIKNQLKCFLSLAGETPLEISIKNKSLTG